MTTLVESHAEQSTAVVKGCVISHPSDAAGTNLSLLTPFYHEQIQSLIQQLFLQPENAPVRHIGVTAAEDSTEIAQLCCEMAQVLAEYGQYDVGLIDASPASLPLEIRLEFAPPETPVSAWSVASHLWFVPRQNWMSTCGPVTEQSTARLREVASEFDFSILCCPGVSPVTARIGRACDGLVLVLTAHQTRRLVASHMKDQLQKAHVSLLGTVLRERRLPIPEALYRSL
jgi:hypothetical protein